MAPQEFMLPAALPGTTLSSPPPQVKIRQTVFHPDLGGRKGAPGKHNRVSRGKQWKVGAAWSGCLWGGAAAGRGAGCEGAPELHQQGLPMTLAPQRQNWSWEGFSLEVCPQCWGSVSICSFYC